MKIIFNKKKEERRDTREIFKEKYNSIIREACYKKQTVTGNIKDVLFENCKFHNITFENLKFENVIFYNCEFNTCKFKSVLLIDYRNIVFDKCYFFRVWWEKSSLENAWFLESSLNHVDFHDVSMREALIGFTQFKRVIIKGKSTIENLLVNKPRGWLDIEFNNNNGIIKVNHKTIIGDFDYKELALNETQQEEYVWDMSFPPTKIFKTDVIGKTYLNIAHQFKMNNMENHYGEYYYKGKRELHKKLPFFKKIQSFLALITCGYGEKWHYGILTSLVIIFGFSFCYMLNGLEMNPTRIINYDVDFTKASFEITWDKIYDFGNSAYFSMMTFTTVGYGNIQAHGEVSHIISFIQMYLGAIIIAIVTGSILRKLFR